MIPASLLLLALACHPDKNESADTDAQDTSTDTDANDHAYPFTDTKSVAGAMGTIQAVSLILYIPTFFIDAKCPAVSIEGDTTRYVGGCTDSGGTWIDGTFTIEDRKGSAIHTFDDFLIQLAEGPLRLDGVASVVPASDGLVTIDIADPFILQSVLAQAPVDATYSAYTTNLPFDAKPPVQAELVANGEVSTPSGIFTMAARLEIDEATCVGEPTGGQAVLTGANVVTLTGDGATNCDGCLPYTISDGGESDDIEGALCTKR